MLHFYFDPLMSYRRSLALITASDLLMVKLVKKITPSFRKWIQNRLEDLRRSGVTPANSTGVGSGGGSCSNSLLPFLRFGVSSYDGSG